MAKKQWCAALLTVALATMDGRCTPLIVGRSGAHIIVATNSIDTAGNSRCKLHLGRHVVVIRATQAASMSLTWPDGHTETVDFDVALNDLLQGLDKPVGTVREMLIADVQQRIRVLLQHYRSADHDRVEIARDLVSEYVIVGREHDGFLGVQAFTLEVTDPRSITFGVSDITEKLHDGEVIDYTGGEANVLHVHGLKAVTAAVYARLGEHADVGVSLGNKAFSPPYLVMDVTPSNRTYVSNPGPCSTK